MGNGKENHNVLYVTDLNNKNYANPMMWASPPPIQSNSFPLYKLLDPSSKLPQTPLYKLLGSNSESPPIV